MKRLSTIILLALCACATSALAGESRSPATTVSPTQVAILAPGVVTPFAAEEDFLAAVAVLGASGGSVIQEGFEDEPPWDAVRTTAVGGTNAAASVSHQGITWTSNHADAVSQPGQVTTGQGPARTGGWGFYSYPHGDSDVVDPNGFIHDGFVGSASQTLYGVGAWLTGFAGSDMVLILDNDEANPISLGVIGIDHQFLGVVRDSGFATFEFREIAGTLQDPKFIWADDVLLATATPDVAPPQVVAVASEAATDDGVLSENEVTAVAITELKVRFSELVRDPPGDTDPDDVSNPANFLLVSDGGDGVFDTTSCAAGAHPSDSQIAVDWVGYVSGSQLEASLGVNGGVALPGGAYRLLVCGTTSIRDWAGNALDGDGDGVGGDDFRRTFTINESPTAVADSATVTRGGTVTVLDSLATSVLANDSDPEDDPLTAELVTPPSHGTLSLAADGTFSYTHDGGVATSDLFFYRARDPYSPSNVTWVTITILPATLPSLSIGDVAVVEGDAGTVAAEFAVSLSQAAAAQVTVDATTVDGTATAGSDYQALSQAVVFAAGTTQQTVSVTVFGDSIPELDETFFVDLSNPVGAELADAQGTGTIVDDEPRTWYVGPGGSDGNDCLSEATACLTIQAAVDRCVAGDTVFVASGTYPENLWIATDITLVGYGSTLPAVDGGASGTVVTVATSAIATIQGFEIRNGGSGGVVGLGEITLLDCWIHHNGDGSAGTQAAVRVEVGALIERCSLTDNHGELAGAIDNGGLLEVVNTTVASNAATSGPAIANQGTLSVASSTVADNGSWGLGGPGTTTVVGTILAGHTVGNCEALVTTLGHNLEDMDSCGLDPMSGDLVNVNPELGPVADHGGLTPTRLPAATSPALDAGDASGYPVTDQRGSTRPADGNGDGVPVCDIGAVELQPAELGIFADGFETGDTSQWSGIAGGI